MSVRSVRFWPVAVIAAVVLSGCQQPHTMHLPDAPQAREVWPDQDGYRHFRADAGAPSGAVTFCEIEHVGLLPT